MHWIMDLRCSYSMRLWYWNYIHTCTQIQDLRYIYILSPLHAVFTILCHPQPATILKFLEASGGRGRSILRPGPRLCQNGCEFVDQFSPSWMEHVRALAFRLERCEAKMEPLLEYGSFMLNPWSFTFPMFVAVVIVKDSTSCHLHIFAPEQSWLKFGPEGSMMIHVMSRSSHKRRLLSNSQISACALVVSCLFLSRLGTLQLRCHMCVPMLETIAQPHWN